MATIERIATRKNLLPYDGLRGWIEKVDAMGDLRLVEGADCQTDIGMATELLNHHPDAPTALFDSIPGYKKGFRVIVNQFGTPARIALTFGLPTDLSKSELSRRMLELIEKSKPIAA